MDQQPPRSRSVPGIHRHPSLRSSERSSSNAPRIFASARTGCPNTSSGLPEPRRMIVPARSNRVILRSSFDCGRKSASGTSSLLFIDVHHIEPQAMSQGKIAHAYVSGLLENGK